MTIALPMRFEDQPLLWTVENVYSQEECIDFINMIEASTPQIATGNPMYRNQNRVIRDQPQLAQDLFARLKPHLPSQMGLFQLVGLNERMRFYRYSSGQYFAPHMDHWYRPSPTKITLHSVLVYFNDDFEGGETQFHEQLEVTIVPKSGMVAIFQHKIRHEGCVVRVGKKYAMRTDLIFSAPDEIEQVRFNPQ